MRYRVELLSGGILRRVFYAPAREAFLVGDYVGGIPYRPCGAAIFAALPFHYRAAFERASLWQADSPYPLFRADMNRKRDGAPMGTIFATLEKESE